MTIQDEFTRSTLKNARRELSNSQCNMEYSDIPKYYGLCDHSISDTHPYFCKNTECCIKRYFVANIFGKTNRGTLTITCSNTLVKYIGVRYE
jgi:hypothetical protein